MTAVDFPRLDEGLELPELIRKLNKYLGAPQGGNVTLTNVTLASTTITSTMRFVPDNLHDVGYFNTTPTHRRPRAVNVATTVRIGDNPASTGDLRLRNTGSVVARNGANNGDLVLLQSSITDKAILGGTGALGVQLNVNGTTIVEASSTGMTVTGDGQISGDLGVGRTPTVDLDVVGQFGVSPLGVAFPTVLARGIDGRFYTVHDIGDWGFVVARAANDAFAANLTLYHTRSATGARTALVSGDGLARITFQGVSQTSGTVSVGAAILATVTGTVSNGVLPTKLGFHTASSGDADEQTERMALTSAGHWVPGATNSYNLGSASFTMATGFFGTEVVTPSIDSGGAVNLVLQRNNVTQLTLGSSTAVFVGTVTGTVLTGSTRVTAPLIGTTTAVDVVFDRNSVTQLTLGSLTATFAGDLTVTGDNLNVNGLTYTWPSAQTANRVLRNTGPGTLAWSQVDLSTDVTGALAGGTVPASRVTTGTFGTGAYAMDSTLAVTGLITATGGVAINATVGTNGVNWRDTGVNRVIARLNSSTVWTVNIRDAAGASIDDFISLTMAAGGTIAFSSARPITAGTYNGQTISSVASFTGSLTTVGTITVNTTGFTAAIFGAAANATGSALYIRAAAGTQREINWHSASITIWSMGVSGAESGSDAGGDFYLTARTDAGASINSPIGIVRASGGAITLRRPVTMTSTLAIGGALSGVTTLALSGDLTYSDASWVVAASTSDAADTARAFFAGGGAAAPGRGSYVGVHGEEHATDAGRLYLIAGNSGYILTLGTIRPNGDGADDLGAASNQYNRLYLDNQVISSLATGTAPFSVASTTKVTNLNADLLDDQTGSYYLNLANATGTLDETLGGTGLTGYTLGDIVYASATDTLSKLAGNTVATRKFLSQTGTGAVSAAPSWELTPYVLQVYTGQVTGPLDSETRYFGTSIGWSTAAADGQIVIPRDGTITSAYIAGFSGGTAGSNENWSLYIRVNDTTDTLIATVSSTSNPRLWTNTALSIAVVAGDVITIKSINPAWATNPTSFRFTGSLLLI